MTTTTKPPPDSQVIETQGPINGIFPPAVFWKALLAAQKAAGDMAKDQQIEQGGKKQKWKFSKSEDWIRHCRGLLHDQGLVVTQDAAIELVAAMDRSVRIRYRITHMVIHAETGLGWQWRCDQPLWDGHGSAGHMVAGCSTTAWKYGLRGILAVAQASDNEDLERRDGSAETYERQRRQQASPRRTNPAPATAAVTTRSTNPAPANPAPRAPQSPTVAVGSNPGPAPQLGVDFANAPRGDQRAATPRPVSPGAPRPVPANPGVPRTAVGNEPMVQHAVAELGAEVDGKPRAARVNPPVQPRATVAPGYDALIGKGWDESFARSLAALPADQQIEGEVRTVFFTKVRAFFNGDWDEAGKRWEGTGFAPNPEKTAPTAASVRAYCMKLDWNTKTTAATAGKG